jgi:CubicO group peptidase (beta-lactamase class C family)
MKDTAFWVPEEKRDRLVTCYRRVPGGLEKFSSLHLAVGQYDREPAFESGGAGLVSTLDDYMAFAQMLLDNGVTKDGRRILSEASVRYMQTPQLSEKVRGDMWDTLGGYNYSCLMRVCDRPGEAPLLTRKGEYGWDGWLGTYFCNIPEGKISFLLGQNVTDAGTVAVTRKCRNLLEAYLSETAGL